MGWIGYETVLEDVTNSKTIGKVSSISGPSMTMGVVDVTSMDPALLGYREFVAGLIDPGEISVDGVCDYGDAGQVQLKTNFDARDIVDYKITFPDFATGTTWEFSAFITSLSFETPMEDKAAYSVTFKITTKPDLTPGSNPP